MKTAILVSFLIGLALCLIAKWQEARATDPGDWGYAIVMMLGFGFVIIAIVLTVGFGLYRLFMSS